MVCNGRYEHTQVVKIIDTQDPVLSVVDSLCFAVDVDCTSKDVSMSGSAIDAGDCGSEWISWEVSIDAYADWTEDFNYATTNPRLFHQRRYGTEVYGEHMTAVVTQ